MALPCFSALAVDSHRWKESGDQRIGIEPSSWATAMAQGGSISGSVIGRPEARHRWMRMERTLLNRASTSQDTVLPF